MEETLSITNDCDALSNKITILLQTLTGFVRDVREARSDVDGVSRELHSLQTALGLLKEDVASFPPELAEHTPGIVEHCSYVVDKLNASLSVLNGADLSKEKKRKRWFDAGRTEAFGFRASLEAHKTLIGLAIDLVGATTLRDSAPGSPSSQGPDVTKPQARQDVVTEITNILLELGELQMLLPGEFEKNESAFSLHEYMQHVRSYAEGALRSQELERPPITGSGDRTDGKQTLDPYDAEEGPDSAIDVDEDQSYLPVPDLTERKSGEKLPMSVRIIDGMIDEMAVSSSRPPTPPPRDAKRLELARNKMTSPFPSGPDSPTYELDYGVVTNITSGKNVPPSVTSSRRGFGRLFSSFKQATPDLRPPTPSTNSSSDIVVNAQSQPQRAASNLNRGKSHRLSLSLTLPKLSFTHPEPVVKPDGFDSMAVFGVPLQRSMQIAKGTSKTRHGDKGGSSKRDFPLCMQKCCFLLTNTKGVRAPEIFAEPGDIFRVAKLKEIFSTGPGYGEDIDWTDYTVYDAADLIMLYLLQLPKPLISESLAKRWITLSRQATLPGSHATRLDQCIDFWEEALGGLRGPSRSLFKLLLNVWAAVASAEEENDMTAERLAGVLLKPVMHVSSGSNRTDYLLSLAFLIRKRAEYTHLMRDNQSAVNRVLRAAW